MLKLIVVCALVVIYSVSPNSARPDPCSDYTCANGGECGTLSNGTPTCYCPPGFSGRHCGEKDPCATFKCSNGGTCVETNERPTCNCPSGFSGSQCEKKDCENNNDCLSFIGEFCDPDNGECVCNQWCSMKNDTVCGTDGISYRSPCDLKRTACNNQLTDLVVASKGNCKD